MPINHPVQIVILRELLFNPRARFSELNVTELTNDHFTFHLKQLLKQGIVVKDGENYQLTTTGKELAGRIDLKVDAVVRQPKIGVSIFVSRKRKGEVEILLGERLKDPSRGEIGWFTEKVRFGEPVQETLSRCLQAETGLSAQFEYVGVERFIRSDGESLEVDVILLCFKATNISGTLIDETNESRNFWISAKEARNLPNTFQQFDEILDLFMKGSFGFEEHRTSK